MQNIVLLLHLHWAIQKPVSVGLHGNGIAQYWAWADNIHTPSRTYSFRLWAILMWLCVLQRTIWDSAWTEFKHDCLDLSTSVYWETVCTNILSVASAVNFKERSAFSCFVQIYLTASLHTGVLPSIDLRKEIFYLFHQKNIDLFGRKRQLWPSFDGKGILRSAREFLIKTYRTSGPPGLVELGRLIPPWPLPLLGSFSLELVHCAGQPFFGIVTWILFSSTPQEHSLHALCLLLVFPLQPLLLAKEESQGTEEKQSKAGMWVAGPSLPITGADVLTWWCHPRLSGTAVLEGDAPPLLPV